jgi:hypothetical protein
MPEHGTCPLAGSPPKRTAAGGYFHVVFTVPAEIARLAFYNRKTMHDILFRATAETPLTIARDTRHLGAEIGFFVILHTWGQNLLYHPHLHCVVPGGGIAPDHDRWIRPKPGFFLPVRVLSRLFRRLFLQTLTEAREAGQLRFPGEIEELKDPARFSRYLEPLKKQEWVVYAKPPFGGAQRALEYLGRYTHRVALSNQRLLRATDGEITFQWKDYRHKHKHKSRIMTLAVREFVRRFLIHVLPAGFRRIRHFGYLANRHRAQKLILCRALLSHPVAELLRERERCSLLARELAQPFPAKCPKCARGAMIRVGLVNAYRWPARPPDTS